MHSFQLHYCNNCILLPYICLFISDKYLVLFFYPLDFTFVCPTEIIAFSDRVEEFRAIGCEVIACSVDSEFSHLAWYLFIYFAMFTLEVALGTG